MKIGICSSIKNAQMVQNLGFSYIETAVTDLMAYSKEDFIDLASSMSKLDIKFKAFNVFFPGDLKLTGPDVDKKRLQKYITEALKRVNDLGGKYIVFGSGGAKKVPDGFNMDMAFQQLVELSRFIGKEAAKYCITIVIEPLNRGECNIINSLAEGAKLVKQSNHPNIKLLADFYHMRIENEDMDEIIKAGNILRHTHIARKEGRAFPTEENEDIYSEFFAALDEIEYEGSISIEGNTDDFKADAIKSLNFLKNYIR